MKTSLLRTRWSAIGAAVAVSLGAGGIGISQATTSSGEMPIYKPIEPCRLADTRPAPNTVGARSTPLGAAETYDLTGWGTVGDCTLPSSTAGLSLNVTAIGPTLPTFLTLFPADSSLPTASHLNPAPGQPPTPNAVNVDLDGTGQFSIYNKQGTVNVIIDVVGYYDDHIHSSVDITNEAGVAFTSFDGVVNVTSTFSSMLGTSIRVPSDGYVEMQVTGLWRNSDSGGVDQAFCQLQKGTVVQVDVDEPWFELNDRNAPGEGWLGFSAHRIVPISAADNPGILGGGQAIHLVCRQIDGDVDVAEMQLSATFFPTSYAPITVITLPPFP